MYMLFCILACNLKAALVDPWKRLVKEWGKKKGDAGEEQSWQA
jgi:hypothetical protein